MSRHRVLSRLWNDCAGQDLIEYGLLATFISLSATAIILNLGSSVESMYTPIPGKLP